MKVILEIRQGICDLDLKYYGFVAGECTADETAVYFDTAFGIVMFQRSDVGMALICTDETDLAAACEGKESVWLVN